MPVLAICPRCGRRVGRRDLWRYPRSVVSCRGCGATFRQDRRRLEVISLALVLLAMIGVILLGPVLGLGTSASAAAFLLIGARIALSLRLPWIVRLRVEDSVCRCGYRLAGRPPRCPDCGAAPAPLPVM